jgi:hypothetical protein
MVYAKYSFNYLVAIGCCAAWVWHYYGAKLDPGGVTSGHLSNAPDGSQPLPYLE